MDWEKIKCILDNAMQDLCRDDGEIIRNDANERSITHRLAVYLEKRLGVPDWNIDCEYNRKGNDIKRLERKIPIESVRPSDLEGKTVFPDIIIHKRGVCNKDSNLIVIEVKKVQNKMVKRMLEPNYHKRFYQSSLIIN